MDDAALLRRAWKGHETAFRELFARYQNPLYRYASRMCGSAAGDDVVQDTFVAVLKPGAFDPSKGTVVGYLFGIARHLIIKQLAHQTALLIDPSDSRVENIAALQDTPYETTLRQQTVAAVRAAVQSLPPLYREVVVLCDLEEMDYAMVAELVQCPIGTVRSRLHRARCMLVKLLTSRVSADGIGTSHG